MKGRINSLESEGDKTKCLCTEGKGTAKLLSPFLPGIYFVVNFESEEVERQKELTSTIVLSVQ